MAKKIALAMMVKNEEALLERALQSCAGVDGIFILDTGSQDRTIEIARKYTDNVYLDWIWTDSFKDGQNHLLSKIRDKGFDFIISLDGDEQLLTPMDEVRAAVEKAKDTVRVTMVAEGGGKVDFGFGRIFRNTPDIFWEGSIHKHLNVPGEGENCGEVKIMYGWSPAHANDPDRSLRMLEKAVKDGENLPRNLFYLGREYLYKERYWDAIHALKRSIKIDHWLGQMAESWLIIANCYLKLAERDDRALIEESAQACLNAIKINPNFKEAIMFMADISVPENQSQWDRMARTANNEGVIWGRTTVDPKSSIAIFAHNDDECLFMAYTLMRVRPLVIICSDSYIQPERGEVGCSAAERRQETINAMKILGCPVLFLGIRDTDFTPISLKASCLEDLVADKFYIPAFHENGNPHHNILSNFCSEQFTNTTAYTSYSKTDLLIQGNIEIRPNSEEVKLKNLALDCYKSQLALASTRPHFDAVRGKSEYFM